MASWGRENRRRHNIILFIFNDVSFVTQASALVPRLYVFHIGAALFGWMNTATRQGALLDPSQGPATLHLPDLLHLYILWSAWLLSIHGSSTWNIPAEIWFYVVLKRYLNPFGTKMKLWSFNVLSFDVLNHLRMLKQPTVLLDNKTTSDVLWFPASFSGWLKLRQLQRQHFRPEKYDRKGETDKAKYNDQRNWSPLLLMFESGPLCSTALAGLFPERDSLERCWWDSARHSTSVKRVFSAMAGWLGSWVIFK